jgi:hypothetical protein
MTVKSVTRPPRPFTKSGLDNLYLDDMDTDFAVVLSGICPLDRDLDE